MRASANTEAPHGEEHGNDQDCPLEQILFDGLEHLVDEFGALVDRRNLDTFGEASLVDTELTVDFATETTPKDVVTVIATRPLTEGEPWTAMERGELIVFRDGEVVGVGRRNRKPNFDTKATEKNFSL